jgi:Thioredoxin
MGNYDYANESLVDTLRNNKNTAIGIIAFLVGLVLLFAVILPKVWEVKTTEVKSYTEVIRDYDIIRGKKDSNITVVLFEDPQCPACQALSKTESEKLESYRDRVKFVYKYVRAVPGHTFSKEANTYIYAAEALAGKGYELVEKSYKSTANPQSLTKSEFLGYAKDLGLDVTALSEKANSKEVATQVAQQTTDFSIKYPVIKDFTKSPMTINGTPGAMIIIDGELNRVTTGSDRTALIDQTKDFNASMISGYLEKYYNPTATSETPTVEPIPAPTPVPAPAPTITPAQ